MRASWWPKFGLVSAWIASCVVGWLARWAALNLTGAELDNGDAKHLFEQYSTIEAISRMIQGTTFFLIVTMRSVLRTFNIVIRSIEE